MVVLIDTNVIVDVLLDREPFSQNAWDIMQMCIENKIKGVIAAHTVTNLFYITRKSISREERIAFIKDLCAVFRISALGKRKILHAADNDDFSDFEDALQEECAFDADADYIITRDKADFASSRVKVVTPDEFLSMMR